MSNRQGLTLVEVICAVALLSTLLVGMLVAHSRHVRQIENAHHVLEATELADRFLAEAFLNDRAFQVGEAGNFRNSADYRWRVRRGTARGPFLASEVVAFEVFRTSGYRYDHPIFRTEILISAEEKGIQTPSGNGGSID